MPAHVAPKIAEALGAAMLQRLHESATGQFTCTVCKTVGNFDAGDDANVVVYQHASKNVVQFTHTGCAESQFVDATALDEGDVPNDFHTLAALFPAPDPLKGPALFLQSAVDVVLPSGDLDTIDVWLSAWQAVGAQLLLDTDEPPVRVKKARLFVDPATGMGELVIGAETWLDTLPPLPDGWAREAIRSQTVNIYVGARLHLPTVAGSEVSRHDVLEAAVRAGNVAALKAAVVKRTKTAPRMTPEQKAAHGLAGDLRSMLTQRARPGQSTDGFNGVPDAVQFSRRPRLQPSAMGSAPLLVIDVPEEDRHVLGYLRANGFSTIADLADGLPNDGMRWQFLLWQSQIAILSTNTDERQKLLFDPFPPVPDWYDLVRKYTGDMLTYMGVLVGVIGITDDATAEAQTHAAMQRGDVVGATVSGMVAQ